MADSASAIEDPGLSRRVLLGLAATGGVGGLLWSTGSGGPASAASVPASPAAPMAPAVPGGTPTVTSGLTPFPQQNDLNFQTQFNYGEAAYGAAEVGEVAAAVEEVQAALAQIGTANLPVYQPYNDTFEALAARLAADADAEKAAGRLANARSKYLRAAGYYTAVLFFILGGDAPTREADVYRAMQRCWVEASALLEPVWTRVEIPMAVRFPDASGTPVTRTVTVPAYWARASGTSPRPTVIINNGSDAQLVDTFAFGGAAALERGYNALMFEGPGQGSLLFEQDIPFTPYWEDVVTPLVDFVLGQPETDPDAVALTGWSFGGLLVMRAAAHEHRIRAVVADPVFYNPLTPYAQLQGIPNDVWVNDVYPSFPKHGPQGQDALRFLLNKRGEIFGKAFHDQALTGVVIQDLVGLLAAIGSYSGDAALFGAITAHSLLLTYEGDDFFTGQDVDVRSWLTSVASLSQHDFTAAEGAQFHCAPMAPQVRNEVVYDWLDGIVGRVPTPPAPPAPIVPPAPVSGGGSASTLAATGLEAGPIAAIAAGLATAGAGAVALASRSGVPRRTS